MREILLPAIGTALFGYGAMMLGNPVGVVVGFCVMMIGALLITYELSGW